MTLFFIYSKGIKNLDRISVVINGFMPDLERACKSRHFAHVVWRNASGAVEKKEKWSMQETPEFGYFYYFFGLRRLMPLGVFDGLSGKQFWTNDG